METATNVASGATGQWTAQQDKRKAKEAARAKDMGSGRARVLPDKLGPPEMHGTKGKRKERDRRKETKDGKEEKDGTPEANGTLKERTPSRPKIPHG